MRGRRGHETTVLTHRQTGLIEYSLPFSHSLMPPNRRNCVYRNRVVLLYCFSLFLARYNRTFLYFIQEKRFDLDRTSPINGSCTRRYSAFVSRNFRFRFLRRRLSPIRLRFERQKRKTGALARPRERGIKVQIFLRAKRFRGKHRSRQWDSCRDRYNPASWGFRGRGWRDPHSA